MMLDKITEALKGKKIIRVDDGDHVSSRIAGSIHVRFVCDDGTRLEVNTSPEGAKYYLNGDEIKE